jgi:hypothetical protein
VACKTKFIRLQYNFQQWKNGFTISVCLSNTVLVSTVQLLLSAKTDMLHDNLEIYESKWLNLFYVMLPKPMSKNEGKVNRTKKSD